MYARSAFPTLTVVALLAALAVSCGSSPIEPQTVTSADVNGPAPVMTKITPASGPVGTVVTITGSGFTPRGNHLTFGRGYIKDLESANGVSVTFTVPDGLDMCSPMPGGPCAGGYPQVMPGDYAIARVGDGGKTLSFTVTRP